MNTTKEELNQLAKSYFQHLKVKEYRADDRSYPWIAKKLGYKYASSLQNHQKLNWLDDYINQQVLQALEEVKSKAFITVGGAKVISPADVEQIEEKYR